MKLSLLIMGIAFSLTSLHAQTKFYPVTSGELIFSWGDTPFTDEFMATYPEAEQVKSPVRFTMFLHLGQYWHVDFTNNIGLYSGIALRNVGTISDETLPRPLEGGGFANQDYKIIRRVYTTGIPVAFKVGSFKDHFFIFAGGELEFAFHWKEKYWNQHSRSGSKTKYTEWFPSSQANMFVPSVFVGAQFPGGVNVKFKYYLDDYYDHSYTDGKDAYHPSSLTRYKKSQMAYVSISWNFNTSYIKKKPWDNDEVASLY